MSCFENIEYKENDFLLLNPLTIESNLVTLSKDDCGLDSFVVGEDNEITKGEGNELLLTSPVVNPPLIDLNCDYFKVKNNLSELKTQFLKSEARKNLGIIIDNTLSTTSENPVLNKVITENLSINKFTKTLFGTSINLGITQGNKMINTTLPAATPLLAGVMSALDKKKLNSLKALTNLSWGEYSNIDNYTTAGTYDITGFRYNKTDNLPIDSLGENATIAGKLIVTVTQEGKTTYRHSIGQTLILTNAAGKETKVYTRNGNRTSYDGGVSYVTEWGNWGNLQTNINVGLVSSLDDIIDNGIYSGVWAKNATQVETFVMIVINNYAAAGQMPKSITQFKYSIAVGGTMPIYETRARVGENDWGRWVEVVNEDTISEMISNEILKIINEAPETFDTLKEISDWINQHGNVVTSLITGIETNAANLAKETKRATSVESDIRNLITKVREQTRDVLAINTTKSETNTFLSRSVNADCYGKTLKQIGGNIVKNRLDISTATYSIGGGTFEYNNIGIITCTSNPTNLVFKGLEYISNHIYYGIVEISHDGIACSFSLGGASDISRVGNVWETLSCIGTLNSTSVNIYLREATMGFVKRFNIIDLTEMFGAGNEPTKEECDRMFGTMDALPQGLTIAQPTGLKSTGFNQWNPENVLINKTITDNAIVDGDRNIAVIECLPCKTGTGENNGYVIGYGNTWSDEGIEVYLTPLNPMEVDGELYLQKLDKDATYGTYVPQIKGYLLVVTPTTDKLCAHFHWSGDRAATDYEPYVESVVTLPEIPQMSEWGLAGISTSGTIAADTIDLDRMVYTKRIGRVDIGSLSWYSTTTNNGTKRKIAGLANNMLSPTASKHVANIACERYTTVSGDTVYMNLDKSIAITTSNISIYDTDYLDDDTVDFKNSLKGVMLYYELAEPEEYPIVINSSPNYINCNVEQITNSKIPVNVTLGLGEQRSLVTETTNLLDLLYENTNTNNAKEAVDVITNTLLLVVLTLEISPNEDDVELDLVDTLGTYNHVVFPAATIEKAGVMSAEDKREQVKMTPLVNGDVIVGQSREVYSRTGKPDSATFLKRTTAGGTSIGGGVATLKQVGGNIVKNLVNGTFESGWHTVGSTVVVNNGIVACTTSTSYGRYAFIVNLVSGHKFYVSTLVNGFGKLVQVVISTNYNANAETRNNEWTRISYVTNDKVIQTFQITCSTSGHTFYATKPILFDLTEMFGAGNEPTKEECDKLFGTMDALPQGLTVAKPTEFKSVGYNQANPANILVGKGIENGAIVDKADSNIAVIECLPCKIGVGENNGYCIHGDFAEGEEVVYLSPLNPITTDGELYMHQLYRNEDKGTYVPQIKGYMLVEVPDVTNLCVHFLWSEDRGRHDYEPYHESVIALPGIPQMSEWGLAGLCSAVGVTKDVYDTIDLENSRYTRRIGSCKVNELEWYLGAGTTNGVRYNYFYTPNKFMLINGKCLLEGYRKVEQVPIAVKELANLTFMAYDTGKIYLRNTTFSTIDEFIASEGEKRVFYELLTPEEYPITVTEKNYISSDYGTEEFDTEIPLNANSLYYQRSLVGETRNFLDRLMAGLGTDDVTVIADRIVTALSPAVVNNDIIEEEV